MRNIVSLVPSNATFSNFSEWNPAKQFLQFILLRIVADEMLDIHFIKRIQFSVHQTPTYLRYYLMQLLGTSTYNNPSTCMQKRLITLGMGLSDAFNKSFFSSFTALFPLSLKYRFANTTVEFIRVASEISDRFPISTTFIEPRDFSWWNARSRRERRAHTKGYVCGLKIRRDRGVAVTLTGAPAWKYMKLALRQPWRRRRNFSKFLTVIVT